MTEATTVLYACYSGNRSDRIDNVDDRILNDAVFYFERGQLVIFHKQHNGWSWKNLGGEGRQ